MKLVAFSVPRSEQKYPHIGILVQDDIFDLTAAVRSFRYEHDGTILKFLERGPGALDSARYALEASYARQEARGLTLLRERKILYPLHSIRLLTPLPEPKSIRDFIAFEEHIKTLREKRGERVPESWYKMPLHYRGDHLTVYGPNDTIPWPLYTRRLDYELELACVIGTKGINISERNAHKYIFGYMIMNDWSCRDIQRDEMAGGLGPAMAKPGASFGPWLVTADELPDLAHLRQNPKSGPVMRARINGEPWSEGRLGSIYWSFSQMIAHISQDHWIYPGEILGSGTVGGGCGVELDRWIKPGDMVELEVEGIGKLRNHIGSPAKRKKGG